MEVIALIISHPRSDTTSNTEKGLLIEQMEISAEESENEEEEEMIWCYCGDDDPDYAGLWVLIFLLS